MKALIIRHTLRDGDSNPTSEGVEIAKRTIGELGPFDKAFVANAKHCIATAEVALGNNVRVDSSYDELADFAPFTPELKAAAKERGCDHSFLWFETTPNEEVLEQIVRPGESYRNGILRAARETNFERGVFVLRGTGLEGLALQLDPTFNPFEGRSFLQCEGFWVEVDLTSQSLTLLSYVRRC